MSLEERIKRFAEQARGYLLEEFAKSLQQDTTVVKWQGYGQDGKLVVKSKDLTPTVDGVGQKYVTKGSDLILDSTGSVEQRKARRSQPAPVSSKKLRAIPPETLVPRSTIIVFPEFEEDSEEVFGWIVIYYSEPYIWNANNDDSTWAWCDPSWPAYNQLSDYDIDTHHNGQPATYGKCLRVSAVYAFGKTASYTGGWWAIDGTADATATLGSLSASVSLTATNGGFVEDYDFDYAIEETNLSQTAECEAEIVYSVLFNSPLGEARADAETRWFQFPNAKIYLQWPDDQNGNVNRITLDLNDYVDYSVYKFERARNYAKLENGATILYHTYSVAHVDTSYEDQPVSSTRFVPYEGNVTTTRIHFGKIYKGILHLRTNLSTGSTTSKYTPVDGYNNDDRLGNIWYNDNGILSIGWDEGGLEYWNHFDDPQAIWQNAFDGDWISAFSGIAYDATAQANLSDGELDFFLEISWDPVNEIWERGFNTLPPYNLNYSTIYYYDPSATADQRWLNGQPYYNDYRDIENLGSLVRFSPTSTEPRPGHDDWVVVDTASYYSSPLLPDYQYEITNSEVNYDDRISEVFISYLPDPEQEENGGYP